MKQSDFTRQLSSTQAVEYLGEWSLLPDNIAYLRINNGSSLNRFSLIFLVVLF